MCRQPTPRGAGAHGRAKMRCNGGQLDRCASCCVLRRACTRLASECLLRGRPAAFTHASVSERVDVPGQVEKVTVCVVAGFGGGRRRSYPSSIGSSIITVRLEGNTLDLACAAQATDATRQLVHCNGCEACRREEAHCASCAACCDVLGLPAGKWCVLRGRALHPSRTKPDSDGLPVRVR